MKQQRKAEHAVYFPSLKTTGLSFRDFVEHWPARAKVPERRKAIIAVLDAILMVFNYLLVHLLRLPYSLERLLEQNIRSPETKQN